MASKIIQFRPREAAQKPATVAPHLNAKARSEALPQWLREHKVDWIFKEAEQRSRQR